MNSTYYELNKDKILLHQQNYRLNNRDHYLNIRKQYYQKNKEYINQYFKEWKSQNCKPISRRKSKQNFIERQLKINKEKSDKFRNELTKSN